MTSYPRFPNPPAVGHVTESYLPTRLPVNEYRFPSVSASRHAVGPAGVNAPFPSTPGHARFGLVTDAIHAAQRIGVGVAKVRGAQAVLRGIAGQSGAGGAAPGGGGGGGGGGYFPPGGSSGTTTHSTGGGVFSHSFGDEDEDEDDPTLVGPSPQRQSIYAHSMVNPAQRARSFG